VAALKRLGSAPGLTAAVLLLAACAGSACRSDPLLPRVPDNVRRRNTEPTQVERKLYYGDQRVRAVYQALQWPDGREQRHGKELEYDEAGNLIAERHFREGEPTGNWTRWWGNGNRRLELQYRGPEVATTMSWWHENGQLAEQGLARDAVREGEWSSWSADGVLLEQGSYARGRRVGHWRFWRADGTPLEEGDFDAGRRAGEWTFYDEAGRMIERGSPGARSGANSGRHALEAIPADVRECAVGFE
jgi:antitoxin component YwqK of YwqJK toxin-antitoxin module